MKMQELHAEFPRQAVSWRAQSLTRDGTKALALAYIDARDVMERLDAVCGPANWQDSYTETTRGRVICTISIRCGDTWVAKSDGAGDTDVEGDKGAISDAFKRAAVKWGVGRYLYDLPSIWVPCVTYQDRNGKTRFDKFKESPWNYVTGRPKVVDLSEAKEAANIVQSIRNVVNLDDLRSLWEDLTPSQQNNPDILAEKEARKAELSAAQAHGVGQ